MRRMVRIISVALALALLIFALCGASNHSETDAPLQAFSFSHSGMSVDQIYAYDVRLEDGRYLADFELYCGFTYCDVPLDGEDVEALEALIDDCELWQWNGFSESNSCVLDGESFGLSVRFADGKTLQAYGNNAFPEGYHDGASAINDFFEALMKENGIAPWNN